MRILCLSRTVRASGGKVMVLLMAVLRVVGDGRRTARKRRVLPLIRVRFSLEDLPVLFRHGLLARDGWWCRV